MWSAFGVVVLLAGVSFCARFAAFGCLEVASLHMVSATQHCRLRAHDLDPLKLEVAAAQSS